MSTNRNFILRSVYLSPEMDDVLRNKAFDKRLSKNELIRHYIQIGMQKEGDLKVMAGGDVEENADVARQILEQH